MASKVQRGALRDRGEPELTSKETAKLLGTVRVLDAVEETAVLVGLHASLDAVEGKGGERGEDAGGAGGYLGAVTPSQRVGLVSSFSGLGRHDC